MSPREPEADETAARDLIEGLRGAWTPQPLEEDELWTRIALGLQPQARQPAWTRARGLIGAGITAAPRAVLLTGAAAGIAATMMLVTSVVREDGTASAQVLRAVDGLTSATRLAFDDESLSSAEASDLRERALTLIDRLDRDEDALATMPVGDLGRVITDLDLVLQRLTAYEESAPIEHLDDARASVFLASTAAATEHARRGEDGEQRRGEEREVERQPGSSGGAPPDVAPATAPGATDP